MKNCFSFGFVHTKDDGNKKFIRELKNFQESVFQKTGLNNIVISGDTGDRW